MSSSLNQFELLINSFHTCLVGNTALISTVLAEKLDEIEDISYGTSFKTDVCLPIKPFANIVSSEIAGNNDKTNFVRFIYQSYSISASHILESFLEYEKIKNNSCVQILYHIRNASVNNNYFILDKKNLPKSIIWRTKKLTSRRDNKECFFNFIGAGDLSVLFQDIRELLKRHT